MVERRHRQRARVEDRIREDKDTGLAKLQFREFALNEVWLETVLLAHDLIIWTQTLLLEGELAVAFHRLKARRRPTHQPPRSSPAAGAGRQAQTIAARREPKPRQRQRGDGRNRRPHALLHPSPPQRLPKPDRSHYSATTARSGPARRGTNPSAPLVAGGDPVLASGGRPIGRATERMLTNGRKQESAQGWRLLPGLEREELRRPTRPQLPVCPGDAALWRRPRDGQLRR